MIIFTVPGKPVGKARPRFANGRAYTPATTKKYEASIRAEARKIFTGTPHIGPVFLRVDAVFKPPKSLSKKEYNSRIGRFHTFSPDADNVLKAVKDALNGIAYVDDSQVASTQVTKTWGQTAQVVISVKRMDPDAWGDDLDAAILSDNLDNWKPIGDLAAKMVSEK